MDKCCGGERNAGDGGKDVEQGEGCEDKEEKTKQAQGASRTDTSLSPFLIFKEKADGDGWCEIVQHKVLGMLPEMWKTLDQDLKMKYEKT